jgi:glycosyltransferase involved in cell wall biosynthesis
MNVIHLASGDLWAGAEVQLFHLAKGLERLDEINLHVVLLNHGQLENALKEHGINVAILDESLLSTFSIIKKFNAIVRKFKPVIIHSHRAKEHAIGGIVAKLNGAKSIRTVHGGYEQVIGISNFRRFIFNRLDRVIAYAMQQTVVAVSSELREELSKYYAIANIVVIENSIDQAYTIEKSNEACNLPVDPESFNIAFIGRFVLVKRVDLFLEIAKQVLKVDAVNRIHFHMVGDGPLFDEFKSEVNKNNMQSRVHLHGFVENVAPFLKQMDLLMFTSEHEGLPMTLLEAMTLEVPVLSRNLPSIINVLCNGNCGYIMESEGIENYVNTILSMAKDSSEAKAKAHMAKEQIWDKYNIDENSRKYLALYKKVLNI